ncbi:hypothetical protein Q4E93_10145 [Flavitalea sp. BT771]|uniref:hypothetical protein n=1 Tax=Flavitalea sp. BT771 TaxID=3063329 RepID=UPI0026E17930|nr:hypothetical protein [Flavitalea sp. BT771]MDO6430948.1 hypothetical protein [Flavitalea sp. BT771]MDV6219855.1 hypothetical protein [Flavitalea sp. BT771]
MKPNALTATVNSVSSSLTALPTAKIVRHPQAKKAKDNVLLTPPDEETIQRLNLLAKQYPFCIRHKGTNSILL